MVPKFNIIIRIKTILPEISISLLACCTEPSVKYCKLKIKTIETNITAKPKYKF